jgi:peptidylprolyl isomerase
MLTPVILLRSTRLVASGLLAAAVLLAAAGCGDPVARDLAEDGLHVDDLAAGDGLVAGPGDHLRIRHTTWIWRDGETTREVATSGGDPESFVLGRGEVMPGWDTGLLGLREGGTRRLILGPEMIGDDHRPRGLAADDILCSEIELVGLDRIETVELAEGAGRRVDRGDYVTIHYEGWLFRDGEKGEQFVSSREQGEPVGVMIGAGMVNRGLDQGLEGMRIGGKRRVVVPPALAYGDAGRGDVPPGATLVYEVQAVSGPEVTVEVLQEGDGPPAGPRDRIRIHLTGWVAAPDGSKAARFQDSRERGAPLDVILGDFKIQPGLEVGLRGMRPGEVRRLHVPAPMAFGARGYHRADRTLVPPDTDVIYEAELLAAPQTVR